MQFETNFNIGDRVYHILPDSPLGIIIDITYKMASNMIYYDVQFDPQENLVQCMEHELSRDKTFV